MEEIEGISDDGKYDFVISDLDNQICLDVFDAGQSRADEAYIATVEFDTVEEALQSGRNWGK